jgi:hypothetical protein
LPNHWLRNGRLNQTAYSLHLFIRDIADGDLVGWLDRRLDTAARQSGPNRLARMRAALVEPLKEVYGVSDKVLMMALSQLFLGAPLNRRRWREVGRSMIAVDTLVHNFLHRTGILHRFRADHAYGLACYQPGGCADIIETVGQQIDARQFNRLFPRTFPRFVQHAIWHYCSRDGLDDAVDGLLAERGDARRHDSDATGQVLSQFIVERANAYRFRVHVDSPSCFGENRRRSSSFTSDREVGVFETAALAMGVGAVSAAEAADGLTACLTGQAG